MHSRNALHELGPLSLGGASTTYAVHSATSESNGNVDVVLQGLNHSLFFYRQIEVTWFRPLQVGGAGVTFTSTK